MLTATDGSSGLFDWGRHRIPSHGAFSASLGTLTLHVEYRDEEIWVACHEVPEDESAPAPDPPDTTWSRWAADERPEELDIHPVLPDRSLVLRPENPFSLLPGARARVYVRLPLWVRVSLPGSGNAVLVEAPSRVLSDSWWGSPTEGKLCYWLDITARRSVGRELFRPDRIICPLHLRNDAPEDLPVEKLLLRTEHLSVFRGQASLWADEVRVRYRGEEEDSEVDVTGRPPPDAPGAPRLTHPRMPMVRGFRARTFERLRSLPGLGN